MSRLYFKEEQGFNQWLIRLIMILPIAIILYFAGSEILMKIDAGTIKSEDYLPLIAILLPIILLIAFNFVKLESSIRTEGIYYRFKPIRKTPRHHKWSDIKKVYVRKCKPIKEYGGWGYRKGVRKSGTAYTVKGNMGLQIELNSGKRILIGTQKPTELERVIRKLEVSR